MVGDRWRETLTRHGYRWLRQLGRGATATVHLIEDASCGERFAAKRLHPHLAVHSGARRRFLDEAALAVRVEHKGILGVTEVHEDEDTPWLVLPYAARGSLADHVADAGPMPPEQVVDMGIAICEALTALHQAGIVHRDLKPQNILLDDALQPMLADLGAARDAQRETLTHTGALVGTLAYMAPEAKQGQGAATPVADVYSLCATLLFLLAGAIPHDAYVPHRFASLSDGVPRALAEVLRRGTSYDASARYAAATALRADLESLQGALHPRPAAPGLSRPSWRPLPLALAAAALLSLVGIGAAVMPRASAASGLLHTQVRPLHSPDDLRMEGALVVAGNLGSEEPATVGCLRFEPELVEVNHLNKSTGDFCVGCVGDDGLDLLLSTNVFQHWSGIYGSLVLPVDVGERYRVQLLLANDANRTGEAARVQVNGATLSLPTWDGSPRLIEVDLIANTPDLVVGLLDNVGRDEERGMISGVVLHALDKPGTPCSEPAP